MPRKAASVEYLDRLVNWCGSRGTFCNLTKITPGNLADYLNSQKAISWRRLKRCNEQIFGNPPAFIAVIEGHDYEKDGLPTVTLLPNGPGIYGLFDSAMRVIYYGKATNLNAEVRQSLSRRIREVRPWTAAKNLKFSHITKYISAYRIVRGDSDFRHDVEALCHKLFVNNTFNQNGGSFKRTS
jgi:hypothetical protein